MASRLIRLDYEDAIDRLLGIMAENYNYEDYPGLQEVFQFNFNIEGKQYPIHLKTGKGKAISVKGRHKNPSLVVSVQAEMWLDFLAERLKPNQLTPDKFKVSGNRKLLLIMPKVFGLQKKADTENLINKNKHHKNKIWKKPKKVITLNGSPQAEKGTTDIYLDRLLEGIHDAGVETEKIYLSKYKINDCTGCQSCWWQTPGICVYEEKDDLAMLYKKWLDSELTIFAYPVYNDSMPAIVKAMIDRTTQLLYPYHLPYRDTSRKAMRSEKERYAAYLLTCGLPEIEQFNPLLKVIEANCRQVNVEKLVNILRPAAWDPILNPLSRKFLIEIGDALQEAGRQLVKKGTVGEEILSVISQQYATADEYRNFINKYAYKKIEAIG